jgi:hypothetical protein
MNAETSTAAIKSTDFEYRRADSMFREIHHKEWTEGMLRHVIAALDGARVAITTDNQTGHTIIGAKLVGFSSTPNVDRGLLIEYPDGHRLVVHIFQLGETIIPLEQAGLKDAKWTALETYRNERAAAHPLFLAKMNGVKPTGTGTWESRVTRKGVVVSYQAGYGKDRAAEPREYQGYIYREISQAEIGILA